MKTPPREQALPPGKESLASLENRVERVLSGEGMAGTLVLSVEFLEDTLLPPFTGRVTRAILYKARCLRGLARKYDSSPRLRPVSLGVLSTPRGTPLYRREGEGRPPLRARAGEVFQTRVSFFTRSPTVPFDLLPDCRERVDIGYTRVRIETRLIEFEEINHSPPEGDWAVKLIFRTPLLLSTKLLAPPFPSLTPLVHQTPQAHRLLPTPGYIVASATRLWAGLVKGIRGHRSAYFMGRLATITIAETEYRLHPETAIYGKDEDGRTLKVRGTVGHVILQPLHPLARRFLPPLLTLAKHLGLGRSRGIGFGETQIQYLPHHEKKGE